jgi:uncharacterized protein (DUF1778 family)
MPGLRKETWWGQNRNLHTLLIKFRESEATDERDIVYALLGISSDAYQNDFLLPDYTKSSQQVIRDTIVFLLSHTDQDQSLYKFLDWKWPEFLQHLDSLSDAVLRSACEKGEEAIVRKLLLPNRVEADQQDNYTLTLLLQRAVWNGHEAIVRLLLEKGADVEAKDEHGQTLLSWATSNNHNATILLLLEKGVNVEAKDEHGQTLLSWATLNNHEATVLMLLENGADVE